MKYLNALLVFGLGIAVAQAKLLSSNVPPSNIGFGSCVLQGAPQGIWSAINATDPEVFVMLGDNIYGDSRNVEVLKNKYDLLGAEPGFQELWRNTLMLATWDDHDFGENDAGASYPMKRQSQALFMDFFKIPTNAPMRSREGVYSSAIIGPVGKRVQFILLDTRYFRSSLAGIDGTTAPPKRPYQPNTDPTSTVLGADQWKWLEQELRKPAELRLLFSSIQVVPEDHGGEKWMNFPHERQRLFRTIADTGARGVVILSGDRHFAELSQMDAGVGYPIYDLTSSGLNRGYTKGWRGAETNRHRVAAMSYGNNFGMIRIGWDSPDPEIRLEIYDEGGDVIIRHKLLLSWLAPVPKE